MGNIITTADLAVEGLADDGRADSLIALAEEYIEVRTGYRFYAHDATITLDGTGTNVLTLPQPCLRLDSVTLDGIALTAGTDYVLYNRRPPDSDDRRWPKIVRPTATSGTVDPSSGESALLWTLGQLNVVLVGQWGFTVSIAGVEHAPREIKRTAVRLVALEYARVGVDDEEMMRRIRVYAQGMSHSGLSASLSSLAVSAGPSGVPEVDRVLALYRHPRAARWHPLAFGVA